MDDNAPKENPPPDSNAAERRPNDKGQPAAPSGGESLSAFNKLDLSQLQGFSFGTQWTQDKSGGSDKGNRSDARARREGGGDGPHDRRDRRAFRRPEGAPDSGARPEGPGAPPRREGPSDRPPRQEFRDSARGGPRPVQPRGGFQDRTPYDSPYFSVTFYPEDTSFNALVKTIRASCRTIELFEIARTVLGKPERFTVLVARKDPNAPSPRPGERFAPQRGGQHDDDRSSGAAPAPDSAPRNEPVAPRPPLYLSVPDGVPFESEDAAIAHGISTHLSLFFDVAEAEVEPPKGNFQVVNRCGVTGELLGPPNYHRYNQIVQQHYAAKAIRIPFEAYRNRIETLREPEAINQWLEKMKRVTRYTWKVPAKKAAAPAVSVPDATPDAPVEPPPAEAQASDAAAAPAAPAAPAPLTFDSLEEARVYLLTQARDRIVRPAAHGRFHGRELETLPAGEVRRAVEGALERQRRFPLDTANALRGRLRREHFTIFKKGAKGVSYVCAVKRKFRVPGQTFAETIGALISFIETHPMIKAGDLVKRFLGVVEGPAEGETLASAPTVEQREKIARMQGDLLWLVREGYVTEFIDGSLYAPPAMVEARKKEVEREDHDPENFPERPGAAEAATNPEAAGSEPETSSAEPLSVPPVEHPQIADPSADPGLASGPSSEPQLAAAVDSTVPESTPHSPSTAPAGENPPEPTPA